MDYKKIYGDLFKTNYNLDPDNEYRYTLVHEFLKNNEIKSFIDIGSGKGIVVNFVKTNYPDIELLSSDLEKYHNHEIDFVEINLCDTETYKNVNKKYDLLTCLDVIEHIDKDCVDNTLKFLSEISHVSILTIANHSDIQNGVEVHRIQEDMTYWSPLIEKYFDILSFNTYYNERLYVLKLKTK